ncbi:MAG: serine hydrolase, partial [Pseudomonadota bacterium]
MSGWTRRAFMAAGIAAPTLGWADTPRFANALARATEMTQLHALVIAQDGEVILGEAIRGPALDRPVNVKSVSKSVISALTGIAIDRGEIAGLDTKVAPLIGNQVPRRADPRVRDITVRHMLTMQSGLREVSGAAYGDWVDSKFWIYDALSKPMIADPGTEMLYSTASYHVLGSILSTVAGQNLHKLANDRLGVPLGVAFPPWTRDPQGLYLGGNDMRISPLGLLQFGEMYRLGGLVGEARVLTEDWVGQSWARYGASKETGHGYGFGWFLWEANGHRIAYARGFGGQMIFIVPELAMTVVMTSNAGRPARMDGHLGDIFALLAEEILGDA